MIERKPNNPRKVAINLAAKRARRKLRAEKGVWPDRDRKYLAWIRNQSCILCDDMIERRGFVDGQPWMQSSATEAAHIGERGLSQKASDYDTIPLCGGYHHRLGTHSHHRLGKHFCAFHELNHPAVVKLLNGLFVAYLEAEGREVPEALIKRLAASA